jgi:hypothetical protein
VVWAQTGIDKTTSFLLGATASADRIFSEPTFISHQSELYAAEDQRQPISLSMDSHGDVVTAWVSYNGERDAVEVAGYQAEGPVLEALQVPAGGQEGTAVAFSVSPLSVWSEITSTTWSWGDGSADSSGPNTTHVFDSPGTYSVTVSSSDALGNTTHITRTITIQSRAKAITVTDGSGAVASGGSLGSEGPSVGVSSHQKSSPLAVAAVFTPFFATRASAGAGSLGVLEELAEIRGALQGNTLIVRCIAGCARPLRKIVHIRSHKPYGRLMFVPPLPLRQSTRIELDLHAKGRLTRFVEYRFVRTREDLIAHVLRKGCLTSKGRAGICS